MRKKKSRHTDTKTCLGCKWLIYDDFTERHFCQHPIHTATIGAVALYNPRTPMGYRVCTLEE